MFASNSALPVSLAAAALTAMAVFAGAPVVNEALSEQSPPRVGVPGTDVPIQEGQPAGGQADGGTPHHHSDAGEQAAGQGLQGNPLDPAAPFAGGGEFETGEPGQRSNSQVASSGDPQLAFLSPRQRDVTMALPAGSVGRGSSQGGASMPAEKPDRAALAVQEAPVLAPTVPKQPSPQPRPAPLEDPQPREESESEPEPDSEPKPDGEQPQNQTPLEQPQPQAPQPPTVQLASQWLDAQKQAGKAAPASTLVPVPVAGEDATVVASYRQVVDTIGVLGALVHVHVTPQGQRQVSGTVSNATSAPLPVGVDEQQAEDIAVRHLHQSAQSVCQAERPEGQGAWQANPATLWWYDRQLGAAAHDDALSEQEAPITVGITVGQTPPNSSASKHSADGLAREVQPVEGSFAQDQPALPEASVAVWRVVAQCAEQTWQEPGSDQPMQTPPSQEQDSEQQQHEENSTDQLNADQPAAREYVLVDAVRGDVLHLGP